MNKINQPRTITQHGPEAATEIAETTDYRPARTKHPDRQATLAPNCY